MNRTPTTAKIHVALCGTRTVYGPVPTKSSRDYLERRRLKVSSEGLTLQHMVC